MVEYVTNRFNKFAEMYDIDLQTECELKKMLSLEYMFIHFNKYYTNADNYIDDLCKLSKEISRINIDLRLKEKNKNKETILVVADTKRQLEYYFYLFKSFFSELEFESIFKSISEYKIVTKNNVFIFLNKDENSVRGRRCHRYLYFGTDKGFEENYIKPTAIMK